MGDNNQDSQIGRPGKIVAGSLLIVFTLAAIITLIAFWPDKTPEPTDKCFQYRFQPFNMRLDTNICNRLSDAATVTRVSQGSTETETIKHIHLNTIILIMVAVAGFLGNMIHIASSFTAFVGAESFKKSWVLWYIVKPFTASALAIALYLAFGATNNPGTVDLDRTLTIALLAGLFTEVATRKLKEVFDVIFNPKDDLPDKLKDSVFKIDDTKTTPAQLAKDEENTIVLQGQKLTAKKAVIKMEELVIDNASITDDQISFAYTIPDEDKDKKTLNLLITDETGKEVLYKKEFPVQGTNAPEADTGTGTNTNDDEPVG